MSSFKLCGLAEDPEVIEGTKEEFNYCLACDYYNTIMVEGPW